MLEKGDIWLDSAISLLENSKHINEAEENIKTILADYNIKKDDFRLYDKFCFRKLNFVLLKTCFKFRIENSHLVAKVLHFVGTTKLMNISIIYVLGQVIPSTDVTSKAALEYFLDHCSKTRYLFHGRRIQDARNPFGTTAIALAVNSRDGGCVEILLRYGCNVHLHIETNVRERLLPSQEAFNESNSPKCYSDRALIGGIRDLFRLLYHTLCFRPNHDIDENIPKFSDSQMDFKNKDALVILSLFLRSVPYIGLDVLRTITIATIALPYTPTFVEINIDFFKKLSTNGYLPTLEERVMMPAALKHLCRCSIRGTLQQAWNLPHGIQKLPLPLILWRYLDLQED